MEIKRLELFQITMRSLFYRQFALRRCMCLNAQESNPILNYEFYLRHEKHKFENSNKQAVGVPVDPRSALQVEFESQPIKRWMYNSTHKISIGFPQIEWITKSQILPESYNENAMKLMETLPDTKIRKSIEEILQECYVFDTKEYERFIKVPADPSDRWNPYTVKQSIDYPKEERLTRNIFTSVLSCALQNYHLPTTEFRYFSGCG